MTTHNDIYENIKKSIGIKEDQQYQKLYNPNDPYGESLGFLATRNCKRFIAVLYSLITNQKNNFDLVVGAGDSGVSLVNIIEIVYQTLNLKPPVSIYLPIIRWKHKWINYTNQEVIPFDNSVQIPIVKEKIKELNSLDNILFVDDEIKDGNTVKAAIQVISEASNKDKLSKLRNVTIVAEDHNFNPENFPENIQFDFYPFAQKVKELNNILSYIVPWEIEKQIRHHFNDKEIGSKVLLNSLLGLPSKDFERYKEYIIEKPVFTENFINKLKEKFQLFLSYKKNSNLMLLNGLTNQYKR